MRIGWILRPLLVAVLVALVLRPEWFTPLLAPLAPANGPVIYTRASLLSLSLSHLALVAMASAAATVVAVTLAVLVTRPAGAAFRPLSRTITNMGQTFPPVAVLALAVPALGFGAGPTLVAARGIGLSRWQRLWRVELPLALPVTLTGIRLSVVIALGTATIGSTVAARTLGEVIIAGLLTNNTAFVVQGGLAVGLFAVLIYDAMVQLETRLARRMGG